MKEETNENEEISYHIQSKQQWYEQRMIRLTKVIKHLMLSKIFTSRLDDLISELYHISQLRKATIENEKKRNI